MFGLSRNKPIAVLHAKHKIALVFWVLWQWSTAHRFVTVVLQIAQARP